MTDEQIPHAGSEDQTTPVWLTPTQVSERYSMSLRHVQRLAAQGVLTRYRLAGSTQIVRFKQSELDALMRPDDPAEADDSQRDLVAAVA